MDGTPKPLPTHPDALMALVLEQQRQLAAQQDKNVRDQKLAQKREQTLQKQLTAKLNQNEKLEERLRYLLVHRFGKRSERFNTEQMMLFNEAEASDQLAGKTVDKAEDSTLTTVATHQRKRSRKKLLTDDLPRVEVRHELSEEQRQCACGCAMHAIGENAHEQLSIIPRQFFVVRNSRVRYGCSCKTPAMTTPVPPHPIPGAQVTPLMLAHIKVSKFLDGIPL